MSGLPLPGHKLCRFGTHCLGVRLAARKKQPCDRDKKACRLPFVRCAFSRKYPPTHTIYMDRRDCMYRNNRNNSFQTPQTDYGPNPLVTNISRATMQNMNYRTALWTGCHLQLTLMCIPAGGEIGLEVHPDTDQFIRIEDGNGIVMMGPSRDCTELQRPVCRECAVFVPAGTWHNILNTGCKSLKISTIYAPPHHPRGTVQATKAEADR